MAEPRGALTLSEIRSAIDGHQILDGISLCLQPGQVHVLIGPNGSGKTSLLNTISGFMSTQSGRIELDGDALPPMPQQRAMMGIGRTFQTPRLFESMSCRENILAVLDQRTGAGIVARLLRSPSARRERDQYYALADDALQVVGLAGLADRQAGQLTPGDRRKLEIARIVVSEPLVVLMDEPTAGLSVEEIDELGEVIRMLADRGISVLAVLHHFEFVVQIADMVTVLDRGVVVAHGGAAEVQRDPKVQQIYLGDADHRNVQPTVMESVHT